MSDLRDLYQDVILEHSRHPRNFRSLEGATARVDGHNPLCGDKITLFVVVDGNLVRDVAFQGSGCAISTASASLMTETLKGKTLEEAERLFGEFHDLVTGSDPAAAELGKLAIFTGVRDFPVRVKCASLAWHTLHAALRGGAETVSTE